MVVNALGLVKQCPSGKPQSSCPYGKISSRFSLHDSYRFLNSLTDEDIFRMICRHSKCEYAGNEISMLSNRF